MDEAAAFRHLEYIASQCGTRPATSEAARKAGDYIKQALDAFVDEVEIHEFSLPRCVLESSRLEVAAGDSWQSVPHKPVWFGGDTGNATVEATLAFGGDGSETFLSEAAVRGKVVLIARDSYIDYPDDILLGRLDHHGPAAVLFTTHAGWVGEPPDVYYNFETAAKIPPPPSAVLGYFDALKLLQVSSSRLRFQAAYRTTKASCRNIVGYLRGRNPSAGSVMVCAHYDTVPGSPGATDDGGGVAMTLTLAEILGAAAKKGHRPERDVIFACWSGHEPGLFGSKNYLIDHPDVLKNTRFVLNIDTIGSRLHLDNIHVCAGPEIEAQLGEILGKLGYEWGMSRGSGGGDMFNFGSAQIPAITLTQGLIAWQHTLHDTFESCHPSAFVAPLAFSKALLDWVAADSDVPRGYPADLITATSEYGRKFGWGLPA